MLSDDFARIVAQAARAEGIAKARAARIAAGAVDLIVREMGGDRPYIRKVWLEEERQVRDARICDAYQGGESFAALARRFKLSPERIRQILDANGLLERLRSGA